MIHVCFGLHDKTGRYSKFVGTAMLSIFENAITPPRLPSITVHILHDNTLTQDNRDKFSYIAGCYSQVVKFYNVEELCADKLNNLIELIPAVTTSRVSVGAFFRLLTPWIHDLQIEKIIYLDADIIVNLDIIELWQIDLHGKVLAAAPEVEVDYLFHPINAPLKYLVKNNFVSYKDYFNSGVLLMNLNHLRKINQTIIAGVKFRGEHPQCSCFDQDILNYLFSKDYIRLPEKLNVFVADERLIPKNQCQIRNAIYHYARFSLNLNMDDPFNRLWMSYFAKTPWFDEKAIGRLYSGFQQIYEDSDLNWRNAISKLSAIMSGKTRVFYVKSANVNLIKNIFLINNTEEIIFADDKESLQELIEVMGNSKGKKVFFIIISNFPYEVLIQAGFTPNEDFLNGMEFLTEAKGINSYSLIKAM